jgi:hypothetical protein
MESKNTYNPEDIESLLMNKSFDELHDEEKNFVMQHIDSKDEYKLMRTTLLAIKKSADNDEAIVSKPEVKEELLLLMEQKSKRGFGWINLNGGFWAFLFPTDVNIFKKPAFQLASLGLLLFSGIFVSNKLMDNNTSNLAINKTNKVESTNISNKNRVQKEAEITEVTTEGLKGLEQELLEPKADNISIEQNEINEKESIGNNEVAETKSLLSQVEKGSVEKVSDEDLKFISDGKDKAIASGGYFDSDMDGDVLEEIAMEEEDEISEVITLSDDLSTRSTVGNTATRNSAPMPVSLNKVSVVSTESLSNKREAKLKKGRASLDSQSLSDDADIIDLLYVTL